MSKETAQRFMGLFSGLTIAHGQMLLKETYKGSGKHEAYHQIVKEPVSLSSWVSHLSGSSIGIIPIRDDGISCVFGAIDIDFYQDFSFVDLLSKIDKIKLPLVVCRSKSGGAHCYLFLNSPTTAEQVHTTLRSWAAAIGYASNARGEATEIFPKQIKLLLDQGDIGSFINMPYADGEATKRPCVILGGDTIKELSPEEFLDYAESKKVDPNELNKVKLPSCKDFSDGPPCMEVMCVQGVCEGNRNTGLFNMAIYAKLKSEDSWEETTERFNRLYIKEPLGSKEISTIIKQLNRKEYYYNCKSSLLSSYCNRTLCLNRKYGIGSSFGDTPSIDRILKIDTDPPTYIVNIYDRYNKPTPIPVTSDELLSTRKMKLKCMERLNYLPFIPAASEWEAQVQKAMEKMDIIEVPSDSSMNGQLLHHLDSYLTKKSRGSTKGDLLAGRPYYSEGKIYFRMVDFYTYLEQIHFKHFKSNQIAVIFRRLQEQGEMGHKALNIQGNCVQTWWKKKELQDIELDIPTELEEKNVY